MMVVTVYSSNENNAWNHLVHKIKEKNTIIPNVNLGLILMSIILISDCIFIKIMKLIVNLSIDNSMYKHQSKHNLVYE